MKNSVFHFHVAQGKTGTGRYADGLLVPEIIWPDCGNCALAASSNLIVTLLMAFWPPAWAMNNVVCCAGDTSRASMSPGEAWMTLVRVIVAFNTVPTRLVMLM